MSGVFVSDSSCGMPQDVMGMAAELFRNIGYEVFTANIGQAALEVLERTDDISALFSDVMMPGMTGIELAKSARQLKPGLKIVLASGYPLPTPKAQHSGFDALAFMNKLKTHSTSAMKFLTLGLIHLVRKG